jgi:DNA-binding IclR family transcriptional regulator
MPDIHVCEAPMIRSADSKSAPVGVISKVLRIFEALSASPAGLQLREIAEQAAINKSTAYRFLAHLESEKYLFRDDSGAYLVGPRLVRLGSGSTYQMTMRKISRPVLQDLRNKTGETVNLGILDGQDVFYVDVVQSRHPFRMASRIGTLRPVYCTAMGKTLLAFLSAQEEQHVLASLRFERFTSHTITKIEHFKEELAEVRRRGYGLDDEEATPGARCVAAPVLLEDEKVVASVSVAGPTIRIATHRISFFAEAVRAAAQTISARLRLSEYKQHRPYFVRDQNPAPLG